jgi:hypothetical protein
MAELAAKFGAIVAFLPGFDADWRVVLTYCAILVGICADGVRSEI